MNHVAVTGDASSHGVLRLVVHYDDLRKEPLGNATIKHKRRRKHDVALVDQPHGARLLGTDHLLDLVKHARFFLCRGDVDVYR